MREAAIKWRRLEIIIDRDIHRKQTTLIPEDRYSPDLLKSKDSPSVKTAAEFFISREFNIPYYYGFSNLVSLSSSNIEQYLELSAELFEYASLAQKRGESTTIPLNMHQEIIKKDAKQQWERISSLPKGKEVTRFLNAIGAFCQSMTYQPNAPYGPGVTGIAISMAARDRLRNPKEWDLYPAYKPLAQLITTAISNNLLEPIFNVLQGEKGEPHLVLYLNRLLCSYFDGNHGNSVIPKKIEQSIPEFKITNMIGDNESLAFLVVDRQIAETEKLQDLKESVDKFSIDQIYLYWEATSSDRWERRWRNKSYTLHDVASDVITNYFDQMLKDIPNSTIFDFVNLGVGGGGKTHSY